MFKQTYAQIILSIEKLDNHGYRCWVANKLDHEGNGWWPMPWSAKRGKLVLFIEVPRAGQGEWQEAEAITQVLSPNYRKVPKGPDILTFSMRATWEQHIQQYNSERKTKYLSPELTFPMLDPRCIWILSPFSWTEDGEHSKILQIHNKFNKTKPTKVSLHWPGLTIQLK